MKIYLLLPLILISAVAHAEWERILDELTYSIASDGERLYAGTENGIYYSRDDGYTWRLGDFNDYINGLTASPSAVYGYSSEHGILRSVTNGNTWHWTNKGFGPKWDGHDLYYPALRQFLITSSGMVIAVCYGSGTWISRDRGDSWHEVTHEWTLPQAPGYSDIPLGTHIWSMGEHDDHLWAIYSSSLAARSPDEGATWQLGAQSSSLRASRRGYHTGDTSTWADTAASDAFARKLLNGRLSTAASPNSLVWNFS